MIEVRPQYLAPHFEVRKLTSPDNLDQARAFQLFEVMRKCGRAHRLAFAYIGASHPALLRPDLLENFMAPRISERFGDQPQLFLCEPFFRMSLRHAGPQPSYPINWGTFCRPYPLSG
jgi:hypothetical protein